MPPIAAHVIRGVICFGEKHRYFDCGVLTNILKENNYMSDLLIIGGSDAGINAALRAKEIDPVMDIGGLDQRIGLLNPNLLIVIGVKP